MTEAMWGIKTYPNGGVVDLLNGGEVIFPPHDFRGDFDVAVWNMTEAGPVAVLPPH